MNDVIVTLPHELYYRAQVHIPARVFRRLFNAEVDYVDCHYTLNVTEFEAMQLSNDLIADIERMYSKPYICYVFMSMVLLFIGAVGSSYLFGSVVLNAGTTLIIALCLFNYKTDENIRRHKNIHYTYDVLVELTDVIVNAQSHSNHT